MNAIMRGFRSVGLYLLPASVLMIAGVLLMALVYYPTPTLLAGAAPQATTVDDQDYWQLHAKAMFMALLTDALRGPQAEQQSKAQTLMHHVQIPFPAEQPALPRQAPPVSGHDDSSRSSRSVLIGL